MMRSTYAVAVSVVLALVSCPSLIVAAGTNLQAGLLEALQKADATQEQKAAACRDLALVGDKDSVPVLAGLLGDEKLGHMARYALEPIADPAVDQALRDSLKTLNGKLLAGVISSIGVRQDVKAVEPLTKLLNHQDPLVACAAASALGQIGTLPAGEALLKAVGEAKGEVQLAAGDALLNGSSKLVAGGHLSEALRFYAALRKQEMPAVIRLAATRAVMLYGGEKGLKVLADQLASDDIHSFTVGLSAAQELPGKTVVPVLVGLLGKIPPDRVPLLIQVLGKQGDAAALPALLERAKNGDKPIRLAAIAALGEIGNDSVVPDLFDLLKDQDGAIIQASSATLAGLPGAKVEDAIVKMLDCQDQALRLKIIDLAGRRRIGKAMPALVVNMADKDGAVRAAAIRSCGEIAGIAEFPLLLDSLVKAQDPGEVAAIERILGSVCSLASDKDACGIKVVEALAKGSPVSKPALLRLLGVAGGAEPLSAVRKAAGDTDPELRLVAIRVLSAWKTADVAPVLLALAKESAGDNEKLLSLRGYLGLAMKQEIPAKERIEICKQAQPLITRDEERNMLQAAMGTIGSPVKINEGK